MGPGLLMEPRRLILTFHGLGEVPDQVEDDERPYWCGVEAFHSILDTCLSITAERGLEVQVTFDDGNDSDVAIRTSRSDRTQDVRGLLRLCGRLETPATWTRLQSPNSETLACRSVATGGATSTGAAQRTR